MTTKFKFGPRQRKWLKALESGKFLQGRGALRERKGRAIAYCCLGVANKVCRLGETYDGVLDHTYEKLGLYTSSGRPMGSPDAPLLSLTELNDTREQPFKEIAKMLRENPERYFSHSA